MKKNSFLLAILTALALLSCSSDNSLTLAEDVNYAQVPAQTLQKVSPISEEQGSDPRQSEINANGGLCVHCGLMSAAFQYPMAGWSSIATCDFTSIPAGSLNSSYQFIISGLSGISTFGIDYVEIQCGNYPYLFHLSGYVNINMSTTALAGTPANVKCYIKFYGKYNDSLNASACQTYTY